jgi:Transposase DNA-binding/Transposase DDE domain
MASTEEWSEAEFGHADLGDERRTRRLVRLAAEVAGRPAGTVTRACATSASREGAFRLLENASVRPEAIRAAVQEATLQRCRVEHRVVVAVDATSLTLTDEQRTKFGAVGAWDKGARGVHAMTALAVTTAGETLGVCGQETWVREVRSVHGRHRRRGRETESRFWLELLLDVRDAFRKVAPTSTPWFQMDRGADCWQVLTLACKLDMLVTVRAAYDRRLDDAAERLWAKVERGPVVARRSVRVAERPAVQKLKRVNGQRFKILVPARQARTADVEIRAARVPILCKADDKELSIDLNAVLVSEVGHKRDPVEWMLLTTHSIRTRRDVLEVVRAYTLRWRVEEFHRAWKRGLCRVEDTQLRSRDAVYKWSTILAAVATRAMRLTQLARTTPDVPCTTELSSTELAALIALREPKNLDSNTVPTLAVAVRWLADLGGYTGPWNGPPGATVIGRGLHDVLIAARAFENRDKKR